MTIHLTRALAVAAGTLMLGMIAGPAAAASQTVAEIAAYAGADRQAVLEAGAKKEGSVLIYTVGTQTKPVMDAFHDKYPFVRVEVFRADTPTVTRRAAEEFRAGKYIVDSLDFETGGLRTLLEAGVLQSFNSPELAKTKKEAIGPGSHWAFDYESYVGMGYNTKAVSEAEAPKTLEDLLDPKWQGKMAVPGTSTFGNWVGSVVLNRGEDFLRKLVPQKIRIYNVSGRALANLVVSGEVPLSPAIFNSHMANSRDEGASVAWRALDGVYASVGALSIAAKAPHPHATMLYIDFRLSRDGQKMMQAMGYATARTDMENPDKPSKILYMTEDPNYTQNYEKWSVLGHQIFGKGEVLPGAK